MPKVRKLLERTALVLLLTISLVGCSHRLAASSAKQNVKNWKEVRTDYFDLLDFAKEKGKIQESTVKIRKRGVDRYVSLAERMAGKKEEAPNQ
jgi:PBP1b-binding outer membrane lipoprotein LpoB